MKLKISDSLALPIDAVTETFGILGRRGSGKSHTGSVMAEEMLKARVPIVAYDPTGAWYGLKSSVDGKAAGYPVVIFGGEHADVPLSEQDGEMIARAVVAERFPAILDCSLLRKGARLKLMADFLETLYHENREAVHFFGDELHTIAPLVLRNVGDATVYQSRCVGALEDIILQGRRRGIGMTGMSQRPALVNANVRSQFGTLIAMQINAPLDRKAIAEWIAEKGTEVEGDRLLEQLPRLERGTGIVWSPVFNVLKTVTFRPRETFDSGRTPGVGEKRIEPKAWAEIDVGKLGATIAAKREEKRANDPAELKRQLAALRKQLDTAAPAKTVETVREVPVLGEAHVKRLEVIADKLTSEGQRLVETGEKMLGEAAAVRQTITAATARTATLPARTPRTLPAPVRREAAPRTQSGGDEVTGGERKILIAAAQNEGGVDREQLSVLVGLKRSSRNAYIQRLRATGLIVDDAGRLVATAEGVAALGADFEPLPTGEALREHWLNKLSGGERAMLKFLVDRYPNAVGRDEVGEGMNLKRSSRNAYIQRLAARNLVRDAGGGNVMASESLFG